MYQLISFGDMDKANDWLRQLGNEIEVVSVAPYYDGNHLKFVICYRVI